MTLVAYDHMLDAVTDALAVEAAAGDVQYELPFAANDNAPNDWLDIPFPAGWEASC